MSNLNDMLDINTPKLLYPKDIIKIGENAQISIGTYSKRNNTFQDVILELNGKEIFLGRFNKEEDSLAIKYNDGKILMGYQTFKKETGDMRIIKVLSLYEMLDDTFISCTEKEALNMFDSNIDDSYLKNKDALIHRSDIEKKKRLR